jgi:Protein of unknown function (DUF4058)
MPSPFPGMDPFLEDPQVFPDLHDSLIILFKQALQSRLPKPYYATSNARTWLEVSQLIIKPDVNVLKGREGAPRQARTTGGLAVASAARTQPVVVHVSPEEVREPFLEIYVDEPGGPRLVTSIEVLSPSNKTPGAHGRKPYRRKQRQVLRSKVHLVEIDLLRGGKHTSAVPLAAALRQAEPFDYHVCIRRFDHPADFVVYPIRLEQRLPEITIPLLPDVPAVPMDLQVVFDQSYDAGPYSRSVHYADTTPAPPLRPEQTEWATRLLREQGLIPPATTT